MKVRVNNMTVGELKAMLEDYDEDSRIVFQPCNSMYGEYIGGIDEDKGVVPLHGRSDYKALILTSDGQCGSVCDEDDLDLE